MEPKKTKTHPILSIVANMSYVSSIGVGAALAGLTLSVLAARILGPEDFGRYQLVIWLVGLGVLFSNLGLHSTLTKFISESEGKGNRAEGWEVFIFGRRVLEITGLMVCLTFFLVSPRLALFFGDPSLLRLLRIASLAIFPIALSSAATALLRGLQRYSVLMWISVGISLVSLGLGTLALLLGWGISGLMASWSLSSFIGLFLLLRHAVKQTERTPSRFPLSSAVRVKILRYGLALVGIGLLDSIVWQRSEILFLGKFRPQAEIAFYAVAFGLVAQVLQFLPGRFGEALLPAFSHLHGKSGMEELVPVFRSLAQFVALIVFPLAVFLYSVATPLVLLIYGEAYRNAVLLVRILLLPAMLQGVCNVGSWVLFGIGRPGVFVKAGVFLAVSNVLLDFLLIPRFGTVGAAVANSLTQLSGVAFGCFYLKWKLGIVYPFQGLGRILLASIAMGICLIPVVALLPGTGGLFAGLLLVFPIYLVALRCFNVFHSEEFQFLGHLEERVPLVWRPLMGSLLRFTRAS